MTFERLAQALRLGSLAPDLPLEASTIQITTPHVAGPGHRRADPNKTLLASVNSVDEFDADAYKAARGDLKQADLEKRHS